MKKNSALLLTTAVLLAAGASLLARGLLTPKAPPAKPVVVEQPAGEILTVASDLQPGDFIDGSHLRWQPVKTAPSRSLYFVRGQDALESLYGATVRQPLTAGTPLRVSAVVRQGEPGFLAAVLSPNMRAVSIPTSRVESNFGLVSPGDHVDVILGLERDKQGQESAEQKGPPYLAAQTILHDVRVLALNNVTGIDHPTRDADDSKGKKDAKPAGRASTSFETVTLEVDPRQAEKLAVAKEIGTLQLALRPLRQPADGEPVEDESFAGITTLGATTDVYGSATTRTTTPKVMAFRGSKQEVIGGTEQ